MMANVFFVALGGATGSVLRYLVSLLILRTSLPTFSGTLAVNILGSLVIGYVYMRFVDGRPSSFISPLLVVGLLGGFTTYSTFSLDVIKLLQDQVFLAMLYILATVFGVVMAAMLGAKLGTM